MIDSICFCSFKVIYSYRMSCDHMPCHATQFVCIRIATRARRVGPGIAVAVYKMVSKPRTLYPPRRDSTAANNMFCQCIPADETAMQAVLVTCCGAVGDDECHIPYRLPNGKRHARSGEGQCIGRSD